MNRFCYPFSVLSAVVLFAGCSAIPKIKIPGIGKKGDEGEEKVVTPANGLPYSSDRVLEVGDVVEVAAYKGLRSSSKLFDNSVTVAADGTVEIGKFGNAKVGGMRASGAADAIGSMFRRSPRTSGARLTVHIPSVNGTKIVRVDGGVARPGSVIYRDDMSVGEAIGAVGGKKSGAGASFVYVSSRGVRKTLVLDGMSEEDPEKETEVRPGDVVEVPAGL